MRSILFSGADSAITVAEAEDPRPGDTQVLVAARYAGLNGIDLIQRVTRLNGDDTAKPMSPGVEVAGTVVATGREVSSWSVGDRVMGLVPAAGLADRVLVNEDQLMPVPESVDDRSAAALPEAVLTAFDALLRGRVALNEPVCIRGVNGGVGIASHAR